MRLKQYLNEKTEPTVKLAIEAVGEAFSDIANIMSKMKGQLFDIDDETALTLLKRVFDRQKVKIELHKSKRGTRKYVADGEFGGEYGGEYVWRIRMLTGFSKVFKKFAKERGMRDFLNPNNIRVADHVQPEPYLWIY